MILFALTNMFFTCILLLLIVKQGCCIPISADVKSTTDKPVTEKHHKTKNVVLFFARPDFNLNCTQHDNGSKYLNISVVGKVKPCTTFPELYLLPTINNIIKRDGRKACDCENMLESSVLSLTGWAENAMGMTTAIVSLINNPETTSTLDQSPGTTEGSSTAAQNADYLKVYNKREFGQLPLPSEINIRTMDLPTLERVDNKIPTNSIPIINVHSPKFEWKDVPVPQYPNKFEDFVNIRRVKRGVEPENVQLLEFDLSNDDTHNILDIPTLKKQERPETIWDLFGVMSAIRKSFFVNFLSPMIDEENADLFENIQSPTIFELVKATVSRLKNSTEKPTLLIVFGASLGSIADPYSDLARSIKCVEEHFEPNDTLLIVTSSCPKNTTGKEMLPIYAKGPNSEMLSKANELYDIPIQIKNVLEFTQSIKGDKGAKVVKKELVRMLG